VAARQASPDDRAPELNRRRRQPDRMAQRVRMDLGEKRHPCQRSGEDVSAVEDRRRQEQDGAPRHARGLVRQQAAAGQHQARQRNEGRNQEHQPPLVADVVDEELQASDRHPQEQQALGVSRPPPARQDAPRANQAEGEHGPHAAERVADREPRHPLKHGHQVVRRLSRDGHLPVVELVVAPMRQHEQKAMIPNETASPPRVHSDAFCRFRL
jgi:hypothetical protein